MCYKDWSSGKPELADPQGDADQDGSSNVIEYGSGTDALDATSRPSASVTIENLSAFGYSERELVFSFDVETGTNDLTLTPSTTNDLLSWSSDPLEFIGSATLENRLSRFQFRITSPMEARRFFRAETSADPSS